MAVLGALGFLAWRLKAPARDFSQDVAQACYGHVAPASREPGLFEYLSRRGVCTLARRVAYERWGDGPRDRVAREAMFDACLLLATDPSKSGTNVKDLPRVPRYGTIPDHFAREHVDQCEQAATAVARAVR